MSAKNIPDPGFPTDDGSADPALAEALDRWARDPSTEPALLDALATARLLVPVVAVLGEVEEGPDGLRREKTSDMAVPTLTAPGGRRALPAFTSVRALADWRADARPVAVPVERALQALTQENADTLVLDLAGPVTYQLAGPALRSLAQRLTGQRSGEDPEVHRELRQVLAAQPEVRGAHLAPGGERSDGTLALALSPGADAARVAREVAAALAERPALRSRLVWGLDLAVLPADSSLPAGALYRA
ncbi:SseB family protein [Streptomyces sp. NPDC005438]|uniref:SseB family protein n=1 Tax=Streptomyces sp. NPDC005438 TaxID=3156880 RepID=UPI0033B53346